MERCPYSNVDSVRCVLPKGHDPVNNGTSVYYSHLYGGDASYNYVGRHRWKRESAQWRINLLINKTNIHTPNYQERHWHCDE